MRSLSLKTTLQYEPNSVRKPVSFILPLILVSNKNQHDKVIKWLVRATIHFAV